MFRRAAPAAAAPAAAAPAESAEAEAEAYAPRVAIVALADLLPREGVGSDAFYVAVRGARPRRGMPRANALQSADCVIACMLAPLHLRRRTPSASRCLAAAQRCWSCRPRTS